MENRRFVPGFQGTCLLDPNLTNWWDQWSAASLREGGFGNFSQSRPFPTCLPVRSCTKNVQFLGVMRMRNSCPKIPTRPHLPPFLKSWWHSCQWPYLSDPGSSPGYDILKQDNFPCLSVIYGEYITMLQEKIAPWITENILYIPYVVKYLQVGDFRVPLPALHWTELWNP